MSACKLINWVHICVWRHIVHIAVLFKLVQHEEILEHSCIWKNTNTNTKDIAGQCNPQDDTELKYQILSVSLIGECGDGGISQILFRLCSLAQCHFICYWRWPPLSESPKVGGWKYACLHMMISIWNRVQNVTLEMDGWQVCLRTCSRYDYEDAKYVEVSRWVGKSMLVYTCSIIWQWWCSGRQTALRVPALVL